MTTDKEYDQFNDIIFNERGVFGADAAALGDAMESHTAVQTDPVPVQGVRMQFNCEGCGKPRILILEYPEVLALKFGLSPRLAYNTPTQALPRPQQAVGTPTHWIFNPVEKVWQLQEKCHLGGCEWRLPVQLRTNEPAELLHKAEAAGYVTEASAAPYVRHCQTIAAHIRKQRG